jgi:hypothetical protein
VPRGRSRAVDLRLSPANVRVMGRRAGIRTVEEVIPISKRRRASSRLRQPTSGRGTQY